MYNDSRGNSRSIFQVPEDRTLGRDPKSMVRYRLSQISGGYLVDRFVRVICACLKEDEIEEGAFHIFHMWKLKSVLFEEL